VLPGCSSAQEPEVERVARACADATGNAEARCDLLAPATLGALERTEDAPCAEVIGELPIRGGSVESVEVWGGDAQVRMAGDTLFLTETGAGWRIVAAVCTPRDEAPYDCELEGP